MSRRQMTARITPGSALDALAESPIVRVWGLTARLHNVVHRYSVMLGEMDHGLSPRAVQAMAVSLGAVNEQWPSCAHPDLLRAFLRAYAGEWQSWIDTLSHAQLLALTEDVEETIARRRTQ